jgi:hypothetical protein
MTLADDFEALTVQRIEEFIRTRQEEHLMLDFKRLNSPDLTAQFDKDNFATALSGFANAVGGIVVWGVTTQKHASGKVDVAAASAEITDLTMAVGRLNEFTGVLVTAAVEGVRHKKIETQPNHGFVATLIPESDMVPHMALAGIHGYRKRNGDRFLPMEHFEIADMFGRRRRPVLRVLSALSRGGTGNAYREVNIDLFLENRGRGSAVAPYVDIETIAGSSVSPKRAGISLPDVQLMQLLWADPRHAFLGRTDFNSFRYSVSLRKMRVAARARRKRPRLARRADSLSSCRRWNVIV